MITAAITSFYIGAILSVLAIMPQANEMPFGADQFLLESMMKFYAFIDVFWPMQVIWECFLWYLGFIISLQILKIWLGNRFSHIAPPE